jgi:hypothetical protein
MAVVTTVYGISSVELQTPIGATIVADSGINFVTGTAPVHRVQNGSVGSGAITTAKVVANEAVVTLDISDFTSAFGFSMNPGDFDKWTLLPHAYRAMVVGNVSANVYNNVFDPRIHNLPISLGPVTLSGFTFVISDPDVYGDSVVVKNEDGSILYNNLSSGGADYLLGYDQNFNCVFTALEGGRISPNSTVTIDYLRGDPTQVTVNDIIGGYDPETDSYTGLEVIETVFPKYQIVPSIICVPKYDIDHNVAAVMQARTVVNNCFEAIAPVQIDTETFRTRNDALDGKTAANIAGGQQIACWPEAALGGLIVSLSTHCAVTMAETDISRNFLPYASPSNVGLPIDSLVLHDGTIVHQPKPAADLLKGQAIWTGLNWLNKWRAWGNYCAIYPNSTDPKDMWISVRRMVAFLKNSLQLQAFQYVDEPMTQRWAEMVRDTVDQMIGYFIKVGALLDGTIDFRVQDNTLGQLEAGHAIFYVSIMPPIPAQWIQFNIQLNPQFLLEIFPNQTP